MITDKKPEIWQQIISICVYLSSSVAKNNFTGKTLEFPAYLLSED